MSDDLQNRPMTLGEAVCNLVVPGCLTKMPPNHVAFVGRAMTGKIDEAIAPWKQRAEAAEAANLSVAVCADHTREVTGEGCLVCDRQAAEAALAECRGDFESHKWAGDRVVAAEAEAVRLRKKIRAIELTVDGLNTKGYQQKAETQGALDRIKTHCRQALSNTKEQSNG